MARRISYAGAVSEFMRYLPPEARRRIRETLRLLREDPLGISSQLDVKRLKVEPPRLLRVRIGEWRIVYEVEPDRIVVYKVFHRSEGYDWLDKL